MGINLGRLGFLTAVAAEEMEGALAQIARGDFVLDTRMGLEVRLEHQGDKAEPFYALNDAVLRLGRVVTC